MEDIRTTYRISVHKPEPLHRSRHTWEDNIKIAHTETEYEEVNGFFYQQTLTSSSEHGKENSLSYIRKGWEGSFLSKYSVQLHGISLSVHW
jgi:hypothetical protein